MHIHKSTHIVRPTHSPFPLRPFPFCLSSDCCIRTWLAFIEHTHTHKGEGRFCWSHNTTRIKGHPAGQSRSRLVQRQPRHPSAPAPFLLGVGQGVSAKQSGPFPYRLHAFCAFTLGCVNQKWRSSSFPCSQTVLYCFMTSLHCFWNLLALYSLNRWELNVNDCNHERCWQKL